MDKGRCIIQKLWPQIAISRILFNSVPVTDTYRYFRLYIRSKLQNTFYDSRKSSVKLSDVDAAEFDVMAKANTFT